MLSFDDGHGVIVLVIVMMPSKYGETEGQFYKTYKVLWDYTVTEDAYKRYGRHQVESGVLYAAELELI